MSDAFLNRMSAKEYNNYHRDLFGDDWIDLPDHLKLNKQEEDSIQPYLQKFRNGFIISISVFAGLMLVWIIIELWQKMF